ncbi:MAG: adenosylcobalamin-dependent ribonucleoside-diphosphate reductase [Bacteroidales bacterium]
MKNYKYEEALEASKQYFDGDELAASVWINKYAMKDSYGHIFEKTPDDMHRRLANEFARIESNYKNPMSSDEIYELLKNFNHIIPQGGPMAGIGNNNQVASLSNCFVIGNRNPSDSYGGILKMDEEQVQLMKRRGGVGHDLSDIRPSGSPVLNSALSSTGIVPFMERYSNSTREVAQDGRRGALMLSISIKHPDTEQFIDAKMEKGKVTGANVSVRIDDDFMEKTLTNKPYVQQFPINSSNPKITKEINASKLWKKIVHNAWKSAEPGILFWDTIIRESVADCYADLGYKTVSTNPCGEIPLCPYDSCRLLAINLYSYVKNPFTKKASFDFDLFQNHCHKAQRLMDDLVDLEMEKIQAIITKIDKDPEDKDVKRTEKELWEKIKEKSRTGRRTGFGITAEGDMLAALGMRYGSQESIDFAEKVQKTLALNAYKSSCIMAKERGAFPIYEYKREVNNPMIKRIIKADPSIEEDLKTTGRRNISLLTIAPTGTTSLMTRTTSGIEPVFSPFYKRRRKVNPNDKSVNIAFTDENGDSFEEYYVFHHHFLTWCKVNGLDCETVKNLPNKKLEELVAKSPYNNATSNNVDWVAKVKLQGKMQKWVDHSISVTVNLPADISEDMVSKVYETAWKSGCKGITVYRDGCRTGVLVHADSHKTEIPKKRPKKLEADVIRFRNDKENWIAFVGKVKGIPYEIFTGMLDENTRDIPKSIKSGWIVKVINEETGKSRYDFEFKDKLGYPNRKGGISHMFNKEFWNYAKLISAVMRNGVPIIDIVNIVKGLNLNDESINSWKTGVERALKAYIPDGTKDSSGSKCENCGSTNLIYTEGCLICQDCGHGKCG